jgi:chromosome segregation protein
LFLRRVTVTGFKSFASKTVLNLEPGVTAVVGPNGSGKSNLADAIRWALGEQSKGRLRLGGRDEVVFAGTQKKARASFAEVVLLFDNEDGSMPIDLTEVEVSRRLYRSGETDYRLAGRSVRLSDIQGLMVAAGFGVGTYAVIGQGMIDSFLMSPPAERKLLFDEAVGIRGPELSREAALRKLEHTNTNLVRLRDIAAELSPRLTSLQGAVKSTDITRDLEVTIATLRSQIIMASVAAGIKKRDGLEHDIASYQKQLENSLSEQRQLERKLADQAARVDASRVKRQQVEKSLIDLEAQRDRLGIELSDARSALVIARQARDAVSKLEAAQAAAQTELASANDRLSELEAEFKSNSDAADRAAQAVERASRSVADAQAALVEIRHSAGDGARNQYVSHALEILKLLATSLSDEQVELEQVRLLVHKAGRLLSHAGQAGANELLSELKTAQKKLEAVMTKRETTIEHQTNVTITIRSLEIDLGHQRQAVDRIEADVRKLTEEFMREHDKSATIQALEVREQKLATELSHSGSALEKLREQVRELIMATGDATAQAQVVAALERSRMGAVAAKGEVAHLSRELDQTIRSLGASQQEAERLDHSLDVRASKDSLEELRSRLVHAEAQLEATTAARRDRVAEYETVDARHTELVGQIADLEAAQANLGQVLSELDVRIRERFKSNFARLSEHFSTYFTQLFGGGSAALELEEDEEGTYGITIKVSPHGKRPVSIAALSGGERALAGVALLAAIIRTNPSPFIVLDEIDAALDEANSARLAHILGHLKEHTQLIVITHNRQTMHAARVLFGITMAEDHTSTLLSMRLEDATQLAAR